MSADAIDQRKCELRARCQRVRRELGDDARAKADAAIAALVLALPEYAQAEVVLSYLGFGYEVSTRGIIRLALRQGKVVALPRCVPGTRQMRWYRVTSLDGLVRGSFGVEEPVPSDESELPLGTGQRMLAVVPGLTFDRRGYRLGYGGGFFDTFLAGFDGVSVGLCRKAQLSADLCAEGVIDTHDIPVQMVATDEEILR